MSAGLYSFETVAAYLGVRRDGLQQLIDEAALPAIKLARGKIVKQKFAASALVKWINRNTTVPLTVDELREELDRVEGRRE